MKKNRDKKINKVINFAILICAITSFLTTTYGIYSSLLPDSFILALLLSFGIQSLLLVINLQDFKAIWIILLVPLLLISSGFSYAFYCETIYENDFYNQAQKILLEKEEEVLDLIDLAISEKKSHLTEEFYTVERELESKVTVSNDIVKDFNDLKENDDVQLKEIYSRLKELSKNNNIDTKETENLIKKTEKNITDSLISNNDAITRANIGYSVDDISMYSKENTKLADQQKILQSYKRFFNVYKGSNLLDIKIKAKKIIQKMNDMGKGNIQKDIDKILEEIRNVLINDKIVANQSDYSELMKHFNRFKDAVEKMMKIHDLESFSKQINDKHNNLNEVDYENPVELKGWKKDWVSSILKDKNNLRLLGQIDKSYANETKTMIKSLNTAERFYIYDINYIEKACYYLTYHSYKVLAIAVLLFAIFIDTVGIIIRIIKHFSNKSKSKGN